MSSPNEEVNKMEFIEDRDEYLANKVRENPRHRWVKRENASLVVRVDPSIIKAPLTKEEIKAKLKKEIG